MSKEGKVLIISMFINFIVTTLKLITGIIVNSKSIIADAFHTLSDFITDIVAFFGSKFSKKRANKLHPDGYGRFEYIIDIFIGIVILILGIYTIYHSFTNHHTVTNILWIIVVIITIILKLLNSRYLMKKGIEYHSPILITSSKESNDDVISSLGVIIIIILSQFQDKFPILAYADTIGGLIIGLIILHTGYDLLKENFNDLLGENKVDNEIEYSIKSILQEYKELEYKRIELETHGSYYVLELDVYILKNIKVFKLLSIEEEIRKRIKKLHYRIKFVDINLSYKTN